MDPDVGTAVGLDTAVAVSGGGHRATLFGLGALLALSQAGVGQHVTSIASVSGGSIANGALASRIDYHAEPFQDVKAQIGAIGSTIVSPPAARSGVPKTLAFLLIGVVVAALLVAVWWVTPATLGLESAWIGRHLDLVRLIVVIVGALVAGRLLFVLITGGGPLFGWWGTWAYLASLVALAEAVFAGIPRLGDVPDALLYVIGSVLLLTLFAWRGGITAWAFGSKLFLDGGGTRLSAVGRKLDHVICATDMHAGEHVYFAPTFVYSWRFGLGMPGDLPLRTAVQASAAFPGVFPVRWVRRNFGFGQIGNSEHHTPPFLSLVDGGVYDNMGDEWAQGLPDRPGQYKPAKALVVVNASASMPYGRVWPLALPLLGGALAFWREKSVLYDSGTAQRRRAMLREFDLAALGGDGYRGTLVHISQSPYKAANAFASAPGPWVHRGARAAEALAFLAAHSSFDAKKWADVATANAEVSTTLVGFDLETAALLFYHGYVLTLVNAHIFLGYEFPQNPVRYEDVEPLLMS